MDDSKNFPPDEPGARSDPDSGAASSPAAQPLDETQPLWPTEPPAPRTGGAPAAPVSFVRNHPLAIGITAATLAVVLISGLTAWGVGSAIVASSSRTASVSVAPSGSGGSAAAPKGGRQAVPASRGALRGTIRSISGSTWTLTTARGATITVIIDSATAFGTKKAPSSAAAFPVGSAVVIVKRAGATPVTAARVVAVPVGRPVPSATPTT